MPCKFHSALINLILTCQKICARSTSHSVQAKSSVSQPTLPHAVDAQSALPSFQVELAFTPSAFQPSLQVLMVQYTSLLQTQIADSQARVQNHQVQMQGLIQQQAVAPNPAFNMQLMALQQQTATEQGNLQQLFLQYSQAVISSHTINWKH
jgi:hypothetical protein